MSVVLYTLNARLYAQSISIELYSVRCCEVLRPIQHVTRMVQHLLGSASADLG